MSKPRKTWSTQFFIDPRIFKIGIVYKLSFGNAENSVAVFTVAFWWDYSGNDKEKTRKCHVSAAGDDCTENWKTLMTNIYLFFFTSNCFRMLLGENSKITVTKWNQGTALNFKQF